MSRPKSLPKGPQILDLSKATHSKRKKENVVPIMEDIQPLTRTQEQFFDAYLSDENKQIFAYGSPGTGKSYLSLYLALKDVIIDNLYDRIIIVRSPVGANTQGFLPGTQEEKDACYEVPYSDIVNKLFHSDSAYTNFKEGKQIQFMTTCNMRGLTWDNAIIIADEVQNMLWEEINTLFTRVGTNSRVLFLGDRKQNDLAVSKRHQESGFEKLMKVASSMSMFELIEFTPEDIVRSELVKSWIMACEFNGF